MPERPNPVVQLPGYSAPWDIPGQAKQLAIRAQAGFGELASEQAAANRLFRTRETDEYTAPLPRRVSTLDDITFGLGLDRATEARVLKLIDEQTVAFQKKGQTQRAFLAINALTEALRHMREVPSETRMEIVKRARAFWRNTQPTDYAKEPTVRAPQKTPARSATSIKSGVRYVIRDALKKAKKAKPLPTGMHVTPPIASEETPVSTERPPPGFTPIPNSRKGGYHKRDAKGWKYWYPGAGITSTAHPEDAELVAAHQAAEAAETEATPQRGPQEAPESLPEGEVGEEPVEPSEGRHEPPDEPDVELDQPGEPEVATSKPRVIRDAEGERRIFHPKVHAFIPAGKEQDREYHEAEFLRHRAAKTRAMRAGDVERAKAHRFAMNFHADRHNRIVAQLRGREYKPKKHVPGVDDDVGARSTIGAPAAQEPAPRERFVPMSESVKGMREKIGKAVDIMSDLMQAHDHLSSLKARRLEMKRSKHPLARRIIAQIDAEIAATKYDIVQLEEAHSAAMKDVIAHQALLRNERIRANPIFQAFMRAMRALAGKAEKLVEGVKGAIEEVRTRDERAAQRARFEEAMASAKRADTEAESGVVKPLGVSREDIAARFGDPEAVAAQRRREEAALRALQKLREAQGEEAEPTAEDETDVTKRAEDENRESEAEAALQDIFDIQRQREARTKAARERQAESAAFERDIERARARRDKAAAEAAAQAERWAERMKGRSDLSVMREALGRTTETGVSSAQTLPATSAVKPRATVASGVRRKKSAKLAVEKSLRLMKSEEWQEVMRLAPKLDAVLKKSAPVQYVVPLRHKIRPPLTIFDLYE